MGVAGLAGPRPSASALRLHDLGGCRWYCCGFRLRRLPADLGKHARGHRHRASVLGLLRGAVVAFTPTDGNQEVATPKHCATTSVAAQLVDTSTHASRGHHT